jgi:hypothetical protein
MLFFNVELSAEHRDEGQWDYRGTSVTPSSDQWHFVGTIIHEFIHGVGFGFWATHSHFVGPDPACPLTNARNIMCDFGYPGINRGWAREHDAHTTRGAYDHFRG